MKIDIKKVEEMRKEGKSLPVIGKYFDVSKSLVSLICQSFGIRICRKIFSSYSKYCESKGLI